jgi:hypothetical protein
VHSFNLTPLDLQVVVHAAHAPYLHGKIFRPLFLIRRLDHTVEETTWLVVSTSTRVKFDAHSATNFDFTDAVMVRSSTYCPVLWPVIDVQPAIDSIIVNASESRMGLSVESFMTPPRESTYLVENRASLDLTFAILILFPRHPPAAIVVLQPVHLTVGVDFVTGSGGEAADGCAA